MDKVIGFGAGFKRLLLAIAVVLAGASSGANAASFDLGSVSSLSGVKAVTAFPLPVLSNSTDTFSFTLTDDASVAGAFSFSAFIPLDLYTMEITLTSGLSTFAQATATGDHLALVPGTGMVFVPASGGSFLVDLAAGNYVLSLTGGFGLYGGSLTFAAPLTTPIPAALPLLATALAAMGAMGWRRRKAA